MTAVFVEQPLALPGSAKKFTHMIIPRNMKHWGTEVFVKYKKKSVNKERHYIVNIYFVAVRIFIHSPKVQNVAMNV